MTQQSRRNFLKVAGGVAAGTVISQHSTEIASALSQVAEEGTEVVWLQGQGCSGDTVSLLQAEHPSLESAIQDFRLEVTFHPTLMAPSGDAAMDSMSREPDVLIVEGSIPEGIPSAATLGTKPNGERKPLKEWVTELADSAGVVVAVGNCAAFGGWPAAENKAGLYGLGDNVTGARGLQFDGREAGGVLGADYTSEKGLPVVNIGGCPSHSDHILLTLATVLNGHIPELDEYNRPYPFFEPLIHDNCSLRGYFDRGEMAEEPGDPGCLYEVGCAGPWTYCDDSTRLWNGGTSVCRNVGAPCIGCMEPAFWDRFSPFYETPEQQDVDLGPLAVDANTAAGVAIGASVAGIGAHVVRKATGYGGDAGTEEGEEE